MATLARHKLINKIYNSGVIPVFYHAELETCKQVLKACYQGGMRVFEFTNRGDNAYILFSHLLEYARKELPSLSLGIGSIYEANTAEAYIRLGADFIVCPILNEAVAKVCHRKKILWVPGCGSLTEISNAEAMGAEFIKIFPASSVGGPGFVKAILGPSPWSCIMPTGGVSMEEENLKSWFDAGVKAVGIGSKLFDKKMIAQSDFDGLQKRVEQVLETYHKITS